MESRDLLVPAKSSIAELTVQKSTVPCPELNRFLYTAVGGDWFWVDRLGWNYAQWKENVDRPELETWIAYLSGTPAGYFELEQQYEVGVEIVYFGLLPQFIGQGIGSILLTRAVERAWELTEKRVWVHTCTLDGPAALTCYISRGFKLYNEEISEKDLPDRPIGPWPGA